MRKNKITQELQRALEILQMEPDEYAMMKNLENPHCNLKPGDTYPFRCGVVEEIIRRILEN